MIPAMPLAHIEDNAILVEAFGRVWRLERAANLEELWEEMGADDFGDERIPYWTELWPASLVLAQWLVMSQEKIRGRACLDLGCGLGFTAMIGKWLGAAVIACDYEPDSLFQARRNCVLNGAGQPFWLGMDWRAPALLPRSCDFVWAGDILYEKRALVPVFDLLELCLAENGKAWIAEPGRGIFKPFIEMAKRRGWRLARAHSGVARSPYPQDIGVQTVIWEASRL